MSIQRQLGGVSRSVELHTESAVLEGELIVPEVSRGLIVFFHGSGGSRFSQRDQVMAVELGREGYATCMVDLLNLYEVARDIHTGEFRYNMKLLAERVNEVARGLSHNPDVRGLPLVYLGGAMAGAAALAAAADQPELVSGIILRGGRPDAARTALCRVLAPTLLVVGNDDRQTLAANLQAYSELTCAKELRLIHAGGQSFNEPGTIERFEAIVAGWLNRHLPPVRESARSYRAIPQP